ncbi:MAG: hypothetical protein LBH75_00475 [Treponema sp.]|nr:hypothetical protein [Treponema sp.]
MSGAISDCPLGADQLPSGRRPIALWVQTDCPLGADRLLIYDFLTRGFERVSVPARRQAVRGA